jgi:hypothetical protein
MQTPRDTREDSLDRALALRDVYSGRSGQTASRIRTRRRFQSISFFPLLQLLPTDTCTSRLSTVYRNLDISGRVTSQGHEVKVNPHILAAPTPDAHQSSCVLPLPALSAASSKKRAVTGGHVARRDAKCVWTVVGESEGKRNDVNVRTMFRWIKKKMYKYCYVVDRFNLAHDRDRCGSCELGNEPFWSCNRRGFYCFAVHFDNIKVLFTNECTLY